MDSPSETGIRAEAEDNVSFCFKDKLKPRPLRSRFFGALSRLKESAGKWRMTLSLLFTVLLNCVHLMPHWLYTRKIACTLEFVSKLKKNNPKIT